MKHVVMATSLIGFVLAASLAGCGARAEVAKEKVIKTIDSMIGSMDVKRKEIEHSVSGLKDGMTQLCKAKIKAQVKREQIQRKVADVQSKIRQTDKSLQSLRQHLVSGDATQLAGVTYTPEDLRRFTHRVLRQRKEYVEMCGGLSMARSRLQAVVDSLVAKQAEYEGQLSEIDHQLVVIDSNRLALKAMQDAARAMSGTEKSLSVNVAQLENQVNDLYAEVEAELMGEDVRWQMRTRSEFIDPMEALAETVQTVDETINQIDLVLSEPRLADATN